MKCILVREGLCSLVCKAWDFRVYFLKKLLLAALPGVHEEMFYARKTPAVIGAQWTGIVTSIALEMLRSGKASSSISSFYPFNLTVPLTASLARITRLHRKFLSQNIYLLFCRVIRAFVV